MTTQKIKILWKVFLEIMKQFFHNELQLKLEGKVAKGKFFVRPAWVQITKKIFQKLGFKINDDEGEDMTDREFKVKMLSSIGELKSNQAVMFKSIDKLESNQAVMFKSIDMINNKVDVLKDEVNNKIDVLKDDMNNKFDVLDQRISKLENYHS